MCLTGNRHRFLQARDFGLRDARTVPESRVLQQLTIEQTQLLTQPIASRQGALHIKAIRLAEIEQQVEASLDD
jgi:hypothetical protein